MRSTSPILDHQFGEYPVYRWTKGPSTWLACPQWGAKLWEWTLNLAGNRKRPVIYWPENFSSPEDYERVRGGNPILFPFSGRTFHKGKEGFWKPSTTHEVVPMPRHGFARCGQFEILSLDQDGFHVRLLPTEQDTLCYPFRYQFEVRYQFEELSLKVDMILHNQDEQPIPWSAGHHFYFAVPWHNGGSRADYEVQMDARKAWRHAADGKLVAQEKPEFPLNTADPNGLDRIHVKLKSNRITLAPRNQEEPVTLLAGHASPPAQNLTVVTWSESVDSPFYCVEPWMGVPNAPENKSGLHQVLPGETDSFHVEIKLD